MYKLALTLAFSATTSGFVVQSCYRYRTPMTSRNRVPMVVSMTESSSSDIACWAFIFDCDGVILEVQRTAG